MTPQEKERILELTNEMDSHVYEISKKFDRLGFNDELDVFWLTELIKRVEEVANGKI